MTNEQIKEIALANGFKLKEQPDGRQGPKPLRLRLCESNCTRCFAKRRG